MKVIVTGGDGQVGQAIKYIDPVKNQILYCSKNELDITDINSIRKIFLEECPDALVNLAAYTAVDMAENDTEKCHSINVKGVKNLVTICQEQNTYFIHLSSDFVFDGKSQRPYLEDDPTFPLNYYGQSKLMGEKEILSSGYSQFTILRSSWIFSSFGRNFLKIMLTLADKELLNVICDQYGRPTYALDLAKVILLLLEKPCFGIFHFSNKGETSWATFASTIFKMAKEQGIISKFPIIKSVSSKNYPQEAERPTYSPLDCTKIEKQLNLEIRTWEMALKDCLEKLVI